MIKCYIVRPKNIDEVKQFLTLNKISYLHDDNIIFANLEEVSDKLKEIAIVEDPVVEKNGKWSFDNNVDYDSEDQARVAFKMWISWVGEFHQ